jgi:hypothetical protein
VDIGSFTYILEKGISGLVMQGFFQGNLNKFLLFYKRRKIK